MHAGRVLGLLFVTLLLSAGIAGGFGATPVEQLGIEADTVTLDVTVQADGDADWEIRHRIRLDDANATDAFEQLQQDIEANPEEYVAPVEQRMNRTVNGAENATGREMALSDVSISTSRRSQPQVEYGIVTYQFEWESFARVDGDAIHAGDAIDQLILDETTVLRMSWPDGYALDSVTPEATQSEGGAIVWEGRQTFDSGQPRIVLVPDDAAGGGPGTATTTETPSPASGDGFPLLPVILVAIVAAAIVVGAILYARDDQGAQSPPASASDETDGEMSAGADADEGPPPELLSNEERVLRLLEDSGGRMKQKELTEHLDWSAARTSQIVGDLRDEGKLESFRLGRENVLTLPDVDIDASDEELDDQGE